MFLSNPIINRTVDFFTLPAVCWRLARWSDCKRSVLGLGADLLRWFFAYRTYPDNYGPCRLWEVNGDEWKYYYGSAYHPYQRAALRREVQPTRYAILFEDKALCEHLCYRGDIRMPRTWGVIEPNRDHRRVIRSWLEKSSADGLIMKPLRGAAGRGIVVARQRDGEVIVSTGSADVPIDRFHLKGAAIVQDLVKQDARMAVFSAKSLNTIRVVTLYTKQDQILVLGATMRCGVAVSYVDNWSAGGVAVGVELATGVLKEHAYDRHGRRYAVHPTTQARFEGFKVPAWTEILELATRAQRLFPYYRLLGMDIGLAENGQPVLIEINESTDLLFQEQTSGPLLKRTEVLKAFGEYGLLINRYQRGLLARLQKR